MVDEVLTVAYPVFAVFSFVFGACIGSFLNVCIYRIPRLMSVVTPRSRCPWCTVQIHWYDNIPLLSFLALRGSCRNCGMKISPRYFGVELLTGILFLLVWLKFFPVNGPRPLGLVPVTDIWFVPVYWVMIGGLVLGTFVDFDHMIIPDRVTIGGTIAGLVISPLLPELHGKETWLQGLVASATGAAVGGILLWCVAGAGSLIFKREAMGMGDVKLLAAIGAFLGWGATIFTIMASSLVGSVVGLSLVLGRRKGMQSRIPYGPYLAIAAVVWVFWGHTLTGWYLDLFRPPEF